jgi:hypothetical protein
MCVADFFHVSHAPGTGLLPDELTLRTDYPWVPAPAQSLVAEWFPEGLTQHGRQYLLDFQSDPNSRTLEVMWELVRRAEFQDKRSRMTSVFAMASLEDALAFRAEFRAGPKAGIYRVDGECCHMGNMRLIGWGATGATAIANARSYWRGERGEASELWECLLKPPVTVTEQVA